MRGRNQVNPTLDRYLKDSFEVIRYVHDSLPLLERIAGRLTPVEDLVEFKNQVEHLYGHLAVLTEASQIILQISDPGFDLMTAPSVPAQRALLGLGSAALRNEDFFAKTVDFLKLVQEVADNLERLIQNEQETDRAHSRIDNLEGLLGTLQTQVDGLNDLIGDLSGSLPEVLEGYATKEDLGTLKAYLEGLIADLGSGIGDQLADLSDSFDGKLTVLDDSITLRISNELQAVLDGDTFTGLAEAVSELFARVYAVEGGLISEAGRITHLESEIVNLDGSIQGVATAYDGLTTQVSLIDGRLTATARDVTDLNVSVADLNHGVFGSGGALDLLQTTVTQQGEDISVESQRLTRLSADVTTLDGSVSAHGDALASLTTSVNKHGTDIEVIGLDTVQLQSRLDLVDEDLTAEATAREDLETRVVQNEEGLLIQGENITQVTASLTGSGNLLSDSTFESEPLGWTVFQRGSGWTTGEIKHNLDGSSKIPEGVNAIGITVSGVPAGEFAIASPTTPVEPNKSFILSGYLAAENCTASLEWRGLNAAGQAVEYGVVGEVSNRGGGKSLGDWPRVFTKIPASHDVVQIEVQLWVRNANTGSPKAWILRPMLEEASLLQEDPSPWVAGVSGLDRKYANATETLRASLEIVDGVVTGIADRVTLLEVGISDGVAQALQDLEAKVVQNEDDIEATSKSLTKLTSSIGAITEWEIFVDKSSAANSFLKLASSDENTIGFQRGVTILRFSEDGELYSSENYDTFTGAGTRSILIAALDAIADDDYIVLVGQPNVGNKPEDLEEAFLRVGGYQIGKILPREAFVLLGRGGLGPGGGAEYFTTGDQESLSVFFTLVRNVPKNLGGQAASAQAIQELTTEVTRIDGEVVSQAGSLLLLGAANEDNTAFLLNQGTVRVSEDESFGEWRSSIDADFADAHARIELEENVRASENESLAQAISLVSAGSGEQFDSKKIWYFDTDLEQWSGNGTPTIVDGWLRPANGTSSPYVSSPDNLGIEGESYRYVKLRIRRVGSPTWRGWLRWTTTTDNAWNTAKQAVIPEPDFNEEGISTIDWADVEWWPNTIRRIRLYLSTQQTATDYFLIDWVAIGRPTPGAGVALVQEETTARVTALATEAAQRNTLAVQMRGDYEGTNVAQLSQGLIHSERQARVTADGVITSRLDLVQATADNAATKAELTSAQNALASADQALAERIDVTEARLDDATVDLVNPSFENDDGWGNLPNGVSYYGGGGNTGDRQMRFNGVNATLHHSGRTKVHVGEKLRAGAFIRAGGGRPSSGAMARVGLRGYNSAGSFVSGSAASTVSVDYSSIPYTYSRGLFSGEYTVPEGVVTVSLYLQTSGSVATGASVMFDDVILERVTSANTALAQVVQQVTADVSALDDEITAQAGTLDLLGVENGNGTAFLLNQNTVRVNDTQTLAQWRNSLQSQFGDVDSRIDTEVQTLAAADQALASRTEYVEVTLANNMVRIQDWSFEDGTGWSGNSGNANPGSFPAGVSFTTLTAHHGTKSLQFNSTGSGMVQVFPISSNRIRVSPGEVYTIGAWTRRSGSTGPAGSAFSMRARTRSVTGSLNSSSTRTVFTIDRGAAAFAWNYAEGDYLVPDDSYELEIILGASNLTSGAFLVDALSIEKKSKTTQVTATSLNTLEAEVFALDGLIGTNIQSINTINGQVGSLTGSVSQLSEVVGSIQGAGIVANSSFEETGGWSTVAGIELTGYSDARTGSRVMRFAPGYTGSRRSNNTGRTPINEGQQVKVVWWLRYSGSRGNLSSATFRAAIRWRDQAGSSLGLNNATVVSGQQLNTHWIKFEGIATARASAASANIEIYAENHASGSGTVYVDDVTLEVLSSEEMTMRAKHTVALNVNGHVSGTVSENDGQTSSFGIQADAFSIVPSSSTGERLHWSDGNIRIYDSSNRLRVRLGIW